MHPARSLLGAAISLSLSGCGFSEFSNRTTDPVVLDLVRDHDVLANYSYETISTDASRRTIFLRFRKGTDRADFVCAEPSPDALEVYENAITAAVKQGQSNVSAEISRNLSTSASPLLYRSQGLQLFRDQMFNLCLMAMNGVLGPDEYEKAYNTSLANTIALVEREGHELEISAAREPVVINGASQPKDQASKKDETKTTKSGDANPTAKSNASSNKYGKSKKASTAGKTPAKTPAVIP